MDFNEHEKALIARLKKAGRAVDLDESNSSRDELDAFEALYRDGFVGCQHHAPTPSPGRYRVTKVFGAYLIRSPEAARHKQVLFWNRLGVIGQLAGLIVPFVLGFLSGALLPRNAPTKTPPSTSMPPLSTPQTSSTPSSQQS